jgi:RNA polymerase sigma-70 factor (ECF subfamily)
MNYESLSDDILINLLKANDENAFKEIYIRFWKQTFNTAYYKLNDKEASKELVQSLFVRIWERRATNNINNLQAYLQTAIKNSIINYLASLIVKEKYENSLSQICATSTTIESTLIYNDLNTAIDNALQHLPTKTATIFRMSRFENISAKEIGMGFNISEKAVEYHITQSLKLMRLHLHEFLTF